MSKIPTMYQQTNVIYFRQNTSKSKISRNIGLTKESKKKEEFCRKLSPWMKLWGRGQIYVSNKRNRDHPFCAWEFFFFSFSNSTRLQLPRSNWHSAKRTWTCLKLDTSIEREHEDVLIDTISWYLRFPCSAVSSLSLIINLDEEENERGRSKDDKSGEYLHWLLL